MKRNYLLSILCLNLLFSTEADKSESEQEYSFQLRDLSGSVVHQATVLGCIIDELRDESDVTTLTNKMDRLVPGWDELKQYTVAPQLSFECI